MIPEKIGRYIILSELGRGGMATVYRAKDPNFDRDVAVKILPQTFLHDPQFRVRFEREAKTIAALEHSSIVPVYDFGEENGQPFIIMRLMSGGSLAEKLEKGRLPLEEAVRIISQIAPGLEAAHKNGIIHRDLKPGNILFDQYDNAFLSDFGIARMAEGDSTLTGSRIIGTPAYMSPEQIQGSRDLDNRSDLYALGIIFYQMLAGNTPFHATTPAKVMMMHIMEPVPNLLKTIPTIPQSVELWLERVLAKDPDDRFPNAVEMADALEAAAQGQAPSPVTKVMSKPAWSDVTTRQSPPVIPAQPSDQPSPMIAEPQKVDPPPVLKTGSSTVKRMFVAVGAIGIIGIIAIIAFLYSGLNGRGPLAMLAPPAETSTTDVGVNSRATNTLVPRVTETAVEIPTETLEAFPTTAEISPTQTEIPISPTPEATATTESLIIGGADKIAFVNANDIWLVNVDGSNLEQITNDTAEKTNLNWLPDGTGFSYISGKCIWFVRIESKEPESIACFESTEYLENFTFSPDGSRVAISVNRELYVVPWDIERLKNVRFNSDLKVLSECEALAPLKTSNNTAVPVKRMRWSNDGERMIILRLANVGGQLADLIQIFTLKDCSSAPNRIDELPASRFSLDGYNKTPRIQDFGFDGETLIGLVSYTRNDGFGHLYIYNTDLLRADSKINPINGECCYRDPEFSPDGRYIVFVYQPFEAGARSLIYYLPYGTIGTGAAYDPVPLPSSFFENPREKPQPVLRPAQ